MTAKTTDGCKWYPFYTLPRAEKKAAEALRKKGIDVYLPLRKQHKHGSDRKKWIEEPFIKSYIFVRIPEQDQTRVLVTRGVARFLYFGKKVASMPDRQVEHLKLLMVSPPELEVTEENLQPGEKVLIKAGLLKGMAGEILSYRSPETAGTQAGEPGLLGYYSCCRIPDRQILTGEAAL